MDPALPRGGLYKIFQQYDAIKSHATRDDGPAPWEPEEDQVKPGEASSAPPQEAPKGGLVSNTTPKPTEVTGFLTPTSKDDGKVTVEGYAPSQKVLTDATRDRPLGKPRSWVHGTTEQMQEEIGRRKMLSDLSHPSRGTFAGDEEGMRKAYADTTATGSTTSLARAPCTSREPCLRAQRTGGTTFQKFLSGAISIMRIG